ncbi:MAG: hypothetical protein GF383_02540 [Candidatus Lokiarchaeota archaeon]|nr:hypothetical protein [Candidatus Lokiarchaeota archaeon]MBD3338300.1 hypothetical protein [Candidatus Lokiarchaeota archaeon]
MKKFSILEEYASRIKNLLINNPSFYVKIFIYGYLAFIITTLVPIYPYFVINGGVWYDWSNSTTTNDDIEHYIYMAYGRYHKAIAPFKYRVLIPFLWGLLLPLVGLNTSILFWNFIFLLGSSLLMDRYLSSLNFSRFYKLIGVLLMNVSFPILQVAYTPNLDIAFLFFVLLFMIGSVEQKPLLVGISAILGVLTKETILLVFPIYLIYNYKDCKDFFIRIFKSKLISDKKILISLFLMFLAFIEFLWIRQFSFNVNYGYRIEYLEFPDKYYTRWLSLDGSIFLLRMIFFTFTILWIAPLGYLIHKWKRDKWLPLLIYSIFGLFIITLISGRIPRVGFFFIVVILPLFLQFLRDFEKGNSNKSLGINLQGRDKNPKF